MDELAEVTRSLSNHNVPYWLDGGTLLGIVRDGHLLSHDEDIDIGMWARDSDELDTFVAEIESRGYATRKKFYRGSVFQQDLIPSGMGRKINVHLYRPGRDHAWCPAGRLKERPSLRNVVPAKSIVPVLFLLMRAINNVTDHYHLSQFPWRWMYDIKTFWVPQSYFTVLDTYDSYPVPSKYEAYLEYKYGDWETVKTDWDYWNDDGALESNTPEELRT